MPVPDQFPVYYNCNVDVYEGVCQKEQQNDQWQIWFIEYLINLLMECNLEYSGPEIYEND